MKSGHALTTEKLVHRILERRLDYENRNAKKEKKELAAYNALMRKKRQEDEEKAALRDGQGDQ